MNLEDIISEAIYFNTTYDPNDNTGIKYHHFLAPVKLYTALNTVFIRIVIKEYTRLINFIIINLNFFKIIKKELPA